MDIGFDIKKIREYRNYTQEYVATQIGISQAAYSKIERGITDISMSKLGKICSVLDINITLNMNENTFVNNKNQINNIINKKLYQEEINLLEQELLTLKAKIVNISGK